MQASFTQFGVAGKGQRWTGLGHRTQECRIGGDVDREQPVRVQRAPGERRFIPMERPGRTGCRGTRQAPTWADQGKQRPRPRAPRKGT
jgi:hypothetical protein